MASPIEETLRELDKWYNELTGGTERPKLLSKLAKLEFCGWLETHLDGLLERVGKHCGLDVTWVIRLLAFSRRPGFELVSHT